LQALLEQALAARQRDRWPGRAAQARVRQELARSGLAQVPAAAVQRMDRSALEREPAERLALEQATELPERATLEPARVQLRDHSPEASALAPGRVTPGQGRVPRAEQPAEVSPVPQTDRLPVPAPAV
jgi:hypothetical protein